MAHPEDRSLLEAALVGYTYQLSTIHTAIADIQRRLGNNNGLPTPSGSTAPRKKHRISAEGRARIAEAQQKRWAAAKKGLVNTVSF